MLNVVQVYAESCEIEKHIQKVVLPEEVREEVAAIPWEVGQDAQSLALSGIHAGASVPGH